jgi:hypothetical protein
VRQLQSGAVSHEYGEASAIEYISKPNIEDVPAMVLTTGKICLIGGEASTTVAAAVK